MALEVNSTSIEYKNKKVIIKNTPENGENISVFVRPGDEIVFEIDGILFEELEFALVGGDIVIEFPEHGSLTFPSMALMSFSNNPPQFNFGNKLFSIENILSKLEEINELPITSVDTSFKIKISDTDEEKGSMPEDKAASFQIIIVPQSTENHERRDDYTQTEEAPKNYNDNSDIIKINTVPSMYTKPYAHSNNFTGYGDGDGNVSDAAKPMFYFKATAHQLVYSESTTADGKPLILGGGGSMGGYKYDSITNQFEAETIDMSARTENMVIRAENSVYFSNTGTSSEIYLSRILRFEPQMPEGFYVNGFSIAGLPTGMVILDKNGNAIGSSIAQDNM
ncbi:MAG: hypothetical protein RBR59_09630, partial [Sulfurimonadaceae bacterium]|nr:hypothetical protein [Sulfurimonadaceae bacterium]